VATQAAHAGIEEHERPPEPPAHFGFEDGVFCIDGFRLDTHSLGDTYCERQYRGDGSGMSARAA
jgi:hypothetical protein